MSTVRDSGRNENPTDGSAEAERPPGTSDEQVNGGKHRGKPLLEPFINGSVPVPGAEREALFEVFGRQLSASRFLDLCAGTGMIGIEAISRGAMLGTFVDRKSRRCGQIRRNLGALEIKTGHGEVFEEESGPFLKRMSRKKRFWDIVFWDPPFEADYGDSVRFFADGAVLRPEGLIAVRHHGKLFLSNVIGVLRRREILHFEETAISIYDRTS
ncbi:MAG TPA: RsmD family RNA methyltransferase [Aridibacter sp.]|nr:RsmD family RNA methyltransferase [Aridibacter sp.]